ncbi:TrkA C-terminal domain-containing protein [Neobacillus sp. PS3-34]|uniref:TrkA C-terminal domain-containing protein n=1 Tax=Neobacillus sp. PS3-34 TaxID=3070678 RepID=UPI0027E1124F|nr:TrkA C-terminal domain-containing protein [Neobacillus sp. PS3-34]WML49887.1 TrkA C-terminal domain-containing protein [Neobacillus sp. PS3-34]
MDYLFIVIYIFIVLAVIELNVIFFTLTGLEKHISRFQVISMLTGTGFTTGESELIISHPVRRKLSAFLILFGAFSLAVIISSISNILAKNFFTLEIAYGAAFLIILLAVLKIPGLQNKLSKKFKGEMKKKYELEDLPIRDVFLTNEDNYFVEVPIHESSPSIGLTLRGIINEEDDINVLFIKRGSVVIRTERLDTELQAGDKVLLYGDKSVLRDKFNEEITAHEEKIIKGKQAEVDHL